MFFVLRIQIVLFCVFIWNPTLIDSRNPLLLIKVALKHQALKKRKRSLMVEDGKSERAKAI